MADVLNTIATGESFCVRTKCFPAEALDVLQQSSLCLDGAHLPRLQHSRASLFAKKGLMHSPAFNTRNDIPTATASWVSFRKIAFSLPEQGASCQLFNAELFNAEWRGLSLKRCLVSNAERA